MTTKKQSRTTAAQDISYPRNHINLAYQLGGWRGALAETHPGFRRNGSYDTPADSRRTRRAVIRAIRNALRKGRKS